MKSTKWERKPLGAVADLCLGKMLDQKKNRGDPLPYLANVNVRWGEFVLDDLRTMRFEPHEMDRYGLKYGDIVMCEGGEPGRCAVWKNQIPGMMIQKAIHRIRPKGFLDHRFLFYNLLNIGQSKKFDQYFTGATIKHLPGEKLALVEVDIPPLPTQRRIASILSAYDDLIENNTRRIAILEEMARRIYEEWFVHFRFPGHEKVRMVESELGLVPEGWNVYPMGSVADVIDCLHSKKPDETSDGFGIFLQLNNIGDFGVLDLSKKFLISKDDYTKWTSRIEAQEGDCVITNVGRVGAVAQIPPGVKAALGRNMTGVRARKQFMTPTYLIQYLLSSHMTNEVQVKKDAGAIMDALNVKGIVRLSVPIPPAELMSQFDQLVRPLRRRLELLVSQNANLRTTRDLLLPKLISGELDVSHLPEPEAMAA